MGSRRAPRRARDTSRARRWQRALPARKAWDRGLCARAHVIEADPTDTCVAMVGAAIVPVDSRFRRPVGLCARPLRRSASPRLAARGEIDGARSFTIGVSSTDSRLTIRLGAALSLELAVRRRAGRRALVRASLELAARRRRVTRSARRSGPGRRAASAALPPRSSTPLVRPRASLAKLGRAADRDSLVVPRSSARRSCRRR